MFTPQEGPGSKERRFLRPMVTVLDLEGDRVPRPLAPGQDPVFSKDGEWVIYSAPAGDMKRVRRMRPDGSARTNVGRMVRKEEAPAISPDGRFILYVSRHNGLDRLFVKKFDGTGDRLLFDDGVVAWPVW